MVAKLKIFKTFLFIATCAGFLCYYFCASYPWLQISEREKLADGNHQYSTQDLLEIGKKYVESLSRDNVNVTLLPACGRFPDVQKDLNISDTFWQVTNTSNGTFYLFNAYFDDRVAVNGSVIRILGLINTLRPTVKTYCQMWFVGIIQPVPVEVHEYRIMWPEYWGENTEGASPFLITCKNPFAGQGLVPTHVSLVEDRCSYANNMFPVSNKRPSGRRKSFLVCWRGANFDDDISIQVIEWAEILKQFKVDTVIVYVEKLHKNVMKVLHHYRRLGFFVIKYIKFPHEFPNQRSQNLLQWLQGDLISYHDAFYENLYQYEFMIPMDVDEFIMPLLDEDRTWHDLIRRTNQRSTDDQIIDGYPLINRFFLLKSVHEPVKDVPKEFRFLSNIYRAANFTPDGGGAKTIMRTDRVLVVHNHFPMTCIDPEYCNLMEVEKSVGQLSHYREDCFGVECVESMQNPVKDTSLWKYKDDILANVYSTMRLM